MALILDGKKYALEIKQNIAQAVKTQGGIPNLAVVLVGNNPASQVYVNNKKKDCEECGILGYVYHLEETVSEDEVFDLVASLSRSSSIHGILVQMPLPSHINSDRIISAIDPKKDVDCFTPYNVGLMNTGTPNFIPCTPGGISMLLRHYNISLAGKHCVIIGRSNIVGKPMAALALQENATVTVCHSHTENIGSICRSADILISAVGQAGFVKPEFVKDGAVIVDVGINRNSAGKLCGDCDPLVYTKSSAYTPVPGGVGQMTRAMLLLNTVRAAGVTV